MMATVNNSSHPLSILLWNTNGIFNNINELQFTLNENRIDIAMISETHLTYRNFLYIHGYEHRADYLDGSSHGGTVLRISNRIPHTPFPPYISDKLQIIASSIVFNSIPISFASVYLLPGCQFPENELSIFILSLNQKFIIGPHFNSKHLNWGSRYTNTRGRSLYRVISSSHAKTLTWMLLHTGLHMPTDTRTFFLSNLPNRFKLQITNLNDPASNHTPVLLHINNQGPSKPTY